MNEEQLTELKIIGHEWIDEIEKLGFTKGWIYARLDRKLKYPGRWKQHFSQMNTEKEVTEAINKLERIHKYCLKVHDRKHSVYRQNIDKIRAVGRQNRVDVEKQRTFISKVIHWLRTY